MNLDDIKKQILAQVTSLELPPAHACPYWNERIQTVIDALNQIANSLVEAKP